LNEKQLALENFKKLYPKIKNMDAAARKRKTYEFLSRKGFNYDIISEIIYEELK
jgi:SOS response regulatory protein OraA/RecX